MSRLTRLLTPLNSLRSQNFAITPNLRVNPLFNFRPPPPPHNFIFRFLPSKYTTLAKQKKKRKNKYTKFATSTTTTDELILEECVDPDGAVVSVIQLRSTQEKYAKGKYEDLYRRKVLPEQLSGAVMTLSCKSTAKAGVCDVYVLGVHHASKESCTEVQALISYLKPQVVFLELCSSRLDVSTFTPQKIGTELGDIPGCEFRVAIEEAMKYGGKVILGDRPNNITLQRYLAKRTRWNDIKELYNLLFLLPPLPLLLPSNHKRMLKEMDIKLKEMDIKLKTYVQMKGINGVDKRPLQEVRKELPAVNEMLSKKVIPVNEPVVHERDQYMSSTLLRVASEHSSVVAVVGMWHLQGIKKHWQQPVEMKGLMQMPPQKPAVSAVKMIASLGVAAAGVAIFSGIYLSTRK